jgi:hypothetical protein
VDEPGVGTDPDAVVPEIAAPGLPAVVVPNLNVSIRILSPGDDGDVTQIGGIGLGGGAGLGALEWDWNWTWNWSCAPVDSFTSAAWNWNWNWDWSADCASPPAPAESPVRSHARQPEGGAFGRPLAQVPAASDEAPARGGPQPAEDREHVDATAPAAGPVSGGPPPPGVLGASVTPAGETTSAKTTSVGDPAALDRPVPRRPPPPIAPPLSGTATAGVGGGGGAASLLLAALLGGLVLLAPSRGARAPMRDRNLHSSLSSERLERPG